MKKAYIGIDAHKDNNLIVIAIAGRGGAATAGGTASSRPLCVSGTGVHIRMRRAGPDAATTIPTA